MNVPLVTDDMLLADANNSKNISRVGVQNNLNARKQQAITQNSISTSQNKSRVKSDTRGKQNLDNSRSRDAAPINSASLQRRTNIKQKQTQATKENTDEY